MRGQIPSRTFVQYALFRISREAPQRLTRPASCSERTFPICPQTHAGHRRSRGFLRVRKMLLDLHHRTWRLPMVRGLEMPSLCFVKMERSADPGTRVGTPLLLPVSIQAQEGGWRKRETLAKLHHQFGEPAPAVTSTDFRYLHEVSEAQRKYGFSCRNGLLCRLQYESVFLPFRAVCFRPS